MVKKFQRIPGYVKEIIIILISYVALSGLWYFPLGKYVTLSDQGLSTIGLALSASVGVLTAIVVSFVLIIWQWSREARSAAFWRWGNALHQLFEFADANLDPLGEIWDEVMQFVQEASAFTLITPMPRDRFIELTVKIWNKSTSLPINTEVVSAEDLAKRRAYTDVTNYLILLTTANFEHRISHEAYSVILRLQGLLYRLLAVLTISIVTVAISVTTTSRGIPEVFNVPLVAVLIGWFVYLLILLGREIKGVTHLEEQFRREVQVPPMEEIFKKYGISAS